MSTEKYKDMHNTLYIKLDIVNIKHINKRRWKSILWISFNFEDFNSVTELSTYEESRKYQEKKSCGGGKKNLEKQF